MKKLSIVAMMAIVAVAFSACGNKGGKVSMKSSADSVSYALGVLNSQYIQGMGIDSADMKLFIKGLKDGMKNAEDKKKEAYNKGLMMGMQMGGQMGEITKKFEQLGKGKISKDLMISGMTSSKDPKINPMQAQALVQGVFDEIMKANQAKGEKFIADKAKEKDVKKLADGTLYKVIKAGNGKKPADGQTVKINYEGKDVFGDVFDSSYERGEPMDMVIGQAIPGFTEALKNMPVGSTWEVYIPWKEAYGEQGSGKIMPYSTLIFKIELIEIAQDKQPAIVPQQGAETPVADSTSNAKTRK